MVRLTTISNVLSGIGLAVIGFALIFWWLQNSGALTINVAWLAWLAGAAVLIIVVAMSVVNTFTEITGFVHPDDKLVSNMFVFLMAIATILVFGVLDEGVAFQPYLYRISSMILIAYVFLFIFVYFSATITQGEKEGKVKEMTARFMLVSLLLGAVMSLLMVFVDWVYTYPGLQYSGAALVLGVFSVALVLLIVFFLTRKYEPVAA